MNERIKLLAEQAGAVKYEVDYRRDAYPTNLEELKKFAELIVEECLQMADEFELDVNTSGLVDRMKQRFGVEE